MYLYTHGDLKKIAACHVKPFELIYQDKDHALGKKKEVLTALWDATSGLGEVLFTAYRL